MSSPRLGAMDQGGGGGGEYGLGIEERAGGGCQR